MRLLVFLRAGSRPIARRGAEVDGHEVVSLAIDEAIRPGFAQYAPSTRALKGASPSFSTSSEASSMVRARRVQVGGRAWSRVELTGSDR